MVSLRWCCKQSGGIKLVETNDNLVQGYLEMAEKSLGTMTREREYNLMFAISACYYSMYYSLYAICMKIGIKCKIHGCTLEFMKKCLDNFYSKEDMKIIKKAFDLRNIAQYYVDRIISKQDSDYIIEKVPLFFSKSKEVLSKINEKYIMEIREEVKTLK